MVLYAAVFASPDTALVEELRRQLPPNLIISSSDVRMLDISLGQGSSLCWRLISYNVSGLPSCAALYIRSYIATCNYLCMLIHLSKPTYIVS